MVGLFLIIAAIQPISISSNIRFSAKMYAEICIILCFGVFLIACVNTWVGVFLLLSLFSAYFPLTNKSDLCVAFGMAGTRNFDPFYSILLYVSLYAVIVLCVQQKYIGILLHCICAFAVLNTVWLALQHTGYDPIFTSVDGGAAKPTGFFANRNEVGAFLAMASIAFLEPNMKWKYFIWIPLIGLYLSVSKGAVISATCGIGIYLILSKEWLLFWFLSIPAILGTWFFWDNILISYNARFEVWQRAYELMENDWLIGKGLGEWSNIFKIEAKKTFSGIWWTTAQNEYVTQILEMGIGFLIITIGYVLNVIRRYKGIAIIPVAILVVILTNSSVNFLFHIPATAIWAVVALAILEVRLRGEKQNA